MSDKPQTSASGYVASIKDSQSFATTYYEKGSDESIPTEEFSGGSFYINLSIPALVEHVISRGEGLFASNGALSVRTGKFTGRSPNDRYIVDDRTTHDKVNWGNGINHPISEKNFRRLFGRMKDHIKDKDLFVFDGFVGEDTDNRY